MMNRCERRAIGPALKIQNALTNKQDADNQRQGHVRHKIKQQARMPPPGFLQRTQASGQAF